MIIDVLSSAIRAFAGLVGSRVVMLVILISPATASADEVTSANAAGVVFGVGYLGEVGAIAHGGLKRDVAYLDRADLTLAVDWAKLVGWRGARLFVNGMGSQGGSPSESVGDAQTVSNIDAADTWKLYEFWLDYQLIADRMSLRAGLYDVNSEFDVIDSAGLFLNASHGIGPDFSQGGINGPSIFPTTSLALRAKLTFPALYVQTALLDGVPGDPSDPGGTHVSLSSDDGVLLVGEIGSVNPGKHLGKIAVGTWWYSTRLPDLMETDAAGSPLLRRNSYGVYALADWRVLSERDRDQGLSIFGRYGIATTDVNRFGHYIGVGAVYTGPFGGRKADQLGVAVAIAINGDKYMRMTGAERSEIALELGYRIALTPWLAVQPDVQYIINPNMDDRVGNALVFFMRLGLSVETGP